MQPITSMHKLEELGRVKLSRNFFMRDFLYSEISNFHQIPNYPKNPDLAVENGERLCDELLEPLNSVFGRIAIRSGYRSRSVNDFGNKHPGYRCGSSDNNRALHIWDEADDVGHGAMACVVIPWFVEHVAAGGDWRGMAYWIHNNLPYSELQIFPNLYAFNIGWHEQPKRKIWSEVPKQKGYLSNGAPPDPDLAQHYQGFPGEPRVAA